MRTSGKSIENPLIIDVYWHQSRGLEGSWRGPGRVLGRLERLDDFLMLFYDFWVRLVGQKRPTWGQLGPQAGTQIAQKPMLKSMQKIDASCSSILVDVFWIWVVNLVPKWSQVGSPKRIDVGNTEKKSPLAAARARFFYDFSDASWHPKSIKNRSKNELTMGRHLGIDLLSVLVDLGTQVGKENGPTSIQEGIQKIKEFAF